jgi:hypothetical protein
VQYLSIVSELSKATAEIQRLEYHYQNSQDLKDLSANRAIAEKCKNELSLLLNINELPEKV